MSMIFKIIGIALLATISLTTCKKDQKGKGHLFSESPNEEGVELASVLSQLKSRPGNSLKIEAVDGSLKSLSITCNSKVKIDFNRFTELDNLSIAGEGNGLLRQIPSGNKLRILNFADSYFESELDLSKFPTSLKSLKIWHSSFKGSFAKINAGRYSNIESLTLSDSKLKSIQFVRQEDGLKSIRTLDLSNNKLDSLPHSINDLRSLEVIFLEGNNLSQIDLSGLPLLKQVWVGKNVFKSNEDINVGQHVEVKF